MMDSEIIGISMNKEWNNRGQNYLHWIEADINLSQWCHIYDSKFLKTSKITLMVTINRLLGWIESSQGINKITKNMKIKL